MNRDMMLRVADAVEAEDLSEFSMPGWITRSRASNSCGTTACVAGFATLLKHNMDGNKYLRTSFSREYTVRDTGREALDLTSLEAHDLFFAASQEDPHLNAVSIMRWKQIIPDALRYMALTNKVNWWDALRAAGCVHGVEVKKTTPDDLWNDAPN